MYKLNKEKHIMYTYKLFQITLSDADIDTINANGHDSVPKQKAKIGMMFDNNIGKKAFSAFEDGHYTHVANITADGLDSVFRIGNIGPESKIERIVPMHSVSVADVIEDLRGIKYVVADAGFQIVCNREEGSSII